MAAELGGSQLSSLLETVPGLASVLRSPVADAIVNMIKAGAGLGEFRMQDAKELIQFATRRGLIPSAEGTSLLEEVEAVAGRARTKKRTGKGSAAPKRAAKPKASKPTTKKAVKPAAKPKAAKSATKKKATKKATKKTVKAKAAKKKR
ncbi:MAG: hypothetical protein JSW51_09330 [Gemmatimonadota bacterium]|nr:MAG: hypothetical protein JSW51_09330 [Gemmatimonadota bacterium]